ncbi:MAG: DUF177 domain-containing protein [Pseudomonadota bacterium]
MTVEHPFSRRVPLCSGPASSSPFDAEATAAERAGLARQWEILGCDELVVAGEIVTEDEAFRCRGVVRGRVTQACVVTFEPVTAVVEASFERLLVVGGTPTTECDVEIDPDAEDIDHLDGPVVDIGEIAAEELALGLDPYPRAPDADGALAATAGDADVTTPFAALARRRADA